VCCSALQALEPVWTLFQYKVRSLHVCVGCANWRTGGGWLTAICSFINCQQFFAVVAETIPGNFFSFACACLSNPKQYLKKVIKLSTKIKNDNYLHFSTNYYIMGIIKNKCLSWLNITIHNQISITSQIPFLKVYCAYVRISRQKRANKQRQVELGRRSSGAACWHVVGTRWRVRTHSRSSGAELVRSARIWRLRVARYMSIHRSSGAEGVQHNRMQHRAFVRTPAHHSRGVWTLNSFEYTHYADW